MDLSFYRDKRVLVTGHTGFKGTWLCKMLVNAGAVVTGYSLEPPTVPDLFSISGLRNKMKNVIADIRKFDHLKTVFEDIPVNRKMKLLSEKTEKSVFPVMRTYIDSNGHMNNAEYFRLIEEILPDGFQWKDIQIVFHKEAMEGEQIHSFLHCEPEGLGISLENHLGEKLTTIQVK